MADSAAISALMADKKYEEAVPALRAAVEETPDDAKLRVLFAEALAGASDFEAALDQYGRAEAFYKAGGLIVQAMGVAKKIEKVKADMENAVKAAAKGPEFESPEDKGSLFEELTEEERTAILGAMELEEREEGDVIISEGDDGCAMFIIVSGSVKVYTRNPKGENVYLAKLGENDFFGEISLLTGKQRTATIAASSKTELLKLDKPNFDGLVETHPRLKELLNEFCENRANKTVEAMIDSLKGKR